MYIADFIAIRKDAEMMAERARMLDAGKPFKVMIIALARKVLTRLNSMVKAERNYRFEPLACKQLLPDAKHRIAEDPATATGARERGIWQKRYWDHMIRNERISRPMWMASTLTL